MRPQLIKKKRVSSLNIILVIIVLVILVLVGIVGYLAYQYSTNPALQQKADQNQDDVIDPEKFTEQFIYEDDSRPYDDTQELADPEALLPTQDTPPAPSNNNEAEIKIVDPESLLPN